MSASRAAFRRSRPRAVRRNAAPPVFGFAFGTTSSRSSTAAIRASRAASSRACSLLITRSPARTVSGPRVDHRASARSLITS
jgi:hypothetical protein